MINHIYSYNFASGGAKLLAEALGITRIKHTGSKFKGSTSKTVINWGSSSVPEEVTKCRIINPPEYISIASNKLTFFNQQNSDHPTRLVPFCTEKAVAEEWLRQGSAVCARTILNGHSAAGLIIVDPDGELPLAPLYTKYVKKDQEYRVHVVLDEVIDIQRKAKKNDFDGPVNWRIRNLANGFIYARNDIEVPPDVTTQALIALRNSGLDFGAVDVLWNNQQDKAYILEINTAPGISGTTVENYAEAFRSKF